MTEWKMYQDTFPLCLRVHVGPFWDSVSQFHRFASKVYLMIQLIGPPFRALSVSFGIKMKDWFFLSFLAI